MKVAELKRKKKIYDVKYGRIVWYTYLCVHPMAESYHILIDMNEDPMRIWEDNLQVILDKNLKSYEEAALYLAEKLEQRAASLRAKNE